MPSWLMGLVMIEYAALAGWLFIRKDFPEAWIFFTYAAGMPGFMMMLFFGRLKFTVLPSTFEVTSISLLSAVLGSTIPAPLIILYANSFGCEE